ncbi:rCG26105, partial [Rattus norvegicus]
MAICLRHIRSLHRMLPEVL